MRRVLSVLRTGRLTPGGLRTLEFVDGGTTLLIDRFMLWSTGLNRGVSPNPPVFRILSFNYGPGFNEFLRRTICWRRVLCATPLSFWNQSERTMPSLQGFLIVVFLFFLILFFQVQHIQHCGSEGVLQLPPKICHQLAGALRLQWWIFSVLSVLELVDWIECKYWILCFLEFSVDF